MFKGIKIKIIDFSTEIMHAGGQKGNILKSLKKKIINKGKVRHSPKKNKNIRPQKNVYTNVHSSVIHNSQKVEATQMPIT